MPKFLNFRTTIICLAILCSCQLSFAQYRQDWRSDIDKFIEQTDSLSLTSQQTFLTRNVIRVDRTFKNDIDVHETWHYTVQNGKIVIFEVRYLVDSTEYIESYYVKDSRLVCMEQYATEFYNPANQNFIAGEVLFYVNDAVKLHISTGKRPDPLTTWRLERRPMEKFLTRYAELKRRLKDVSLLER